MNETREHILHTSLSLFLQKSFKVVTMKEIVSKTGLSKGAFYHYFESKEDLFKEIVSMFFSMGGINYKEFEQDSLLDFYKQYLHHITISTTQLYEFLGNSGKEKVSFNFFLIMFDAMAMFPEFLEVEKEQYRQSLRVWEKVINTAKENGEIHSKSSNRQIADMFLYSTDGVFFRSLNYDGNSSYIELLSDNFDTLYTNLKL